MATAKVQSSNPMQMIRITKVTLNIGAGKNEDHLKKGLKLLGKLSAPVQPVKTVTQKRIPGWGLRPGLAIGCKVTVRKDAENLLKRILAEKSNQLLLRNFDNEGNFSFGVPEYIDIAGMDYDPELKIMGLEVAVTLTRPGFRIKDRRIKPSPVGRAQRITKEQAVAFVKERLGVEVN